VYEGKDSDVASQGVVLHSPGGALPLVQRAIGFFSTEYYALAADGSTTLLPLPQGADLKGALGERLLFTLRDDWQPPQGTLIPKGSLVAFERTGGVSVLFTPDAHSAIDEVSAGRDAVYASIYHDVTGSVHAFRPQADGSWSADAGAIFHLDSDDVRPTAKPGWTSADAAAMRHRRCSTMPESVCTIVVAAATGRTYRATSIARFSASSENSNDFS